MSWCFRKGLMFGWVVSVFSVIFSVVGLLVLVGMLMLSIFFGLVEKCDVMLIIGFFMKLGLLLL